MTKVDYVFSIAMGIALVGFITTLVVMNL